jgi:hypothetical protein
VIFSNCASTINTTGALKSETKIKEIGIVCVTPDRIERFSNDLCQSLKNSLTNLGVATTTEVYVENIPTLTDEKGDSSIIEDQDLVLKITHIRIALYNGAPCGTLMNIGMYAKSNVKKPIWVARIQTRGSNVTGPGNPERVSKEIIDQLIIDGFKFEN